MNVMESTSGTLVWEVVPNDFKVLWLNTTLKFVKDDKQSLLKYPEMPANKIKFLKMMITTSNTNRFFSPLWEALKIMSLKYDFRMFVERTGTEKGHLFLKKILKNEGSDQGKTKLEPTKPVPTKSEPTKTKSSQKKRERKKRKKEFIETVREQVDSISPLFIKNTLSTVYKFVSDEAQASLPFDSLSRIEAQFVYNFNGILKRKESLKDLFSPVCNMLWTKIKDTLNGTTPLELKISSINVDPATAKRQMMLWKCPKYVNKKTADVNYSVDWESQNENESPNFSDKDNSNGLKLLNSIENSALKDSKQQESRPVTSLNEPEQAGGKESTNDMKSPKENIPVKPSKNTNLEGSEEPAMNSADAKLDPKAAVNSEPAAQNAEATSQMKTVNEKTQTTVEKTLACRKRDVTIQLPTMSRNYSINWQGQKENESSNLSEMDKSDINRLKLLSSIENCALRDSKQQARPVKSLNEPEQAGRKESTNDMKSSKENIPVKPSKSKNLEGSEEPAMNSLNATLDPKAAVNSEPAAQNAEGSSQMKTVNDKTQTTVEKTFACRKRDVTIQLPTMSRVCALKEMNTRLPQTKAKLIEAMSKPVESEIGLRMMRSMGWEGGALGTREGGITEPIMPALHLSSKAGLGHVATKKADSGGLDFRTLVLENIVNLLKSSSTELIIDFFDELSKKEMRFLATVKRAFKSRKRLAVNLKGEEYLVNSITSYLSSRPDLTVDVQAENKKQIKLEKKAIATQKQKNQKVDEIVKSLPDERLDEQKKSIKLSKILATNEHEFEDDVILSLLDEIEQSKMSKKSMQKLKKRLYIIKSVLDLIQSDAESVALNCMLTSSSMRNYLHTLCTAINSRQDQNFLFSIETFVWMEIQQNLKGRDLYVIVQMDSSFFSLKKISSLNVKNYENYEESTQSDSSCTGSPWSDDVGPKECDGGDSAANISDIYIFNTDKTNSRMTNVRIIQRIGRPMTIDTVKEIQNRISNAIISAPFPMLKCHGVRNDSLVYTCYDWHSFAFLKEVLRDFQIVEYEMSRLLKMVATYKSDASLSKVLHWLKLYHNLDVFKWDILSSSINDHTSFTACMDLESFQYICMKNFRLLAGIDELTFEITV